MGRRHLYPTVPPLTSFRVTYTVLLFIRVQTCDETSVSMYWRRKEVSIPNDITAVPLFSRQVPEPSSIILHIKQRFSYSTQSHMAPLKTVTVSSLRTLTNAAPYLSAVDIYASNYEGVSPFMSPYQRQLAESEGLEPPPRKDGERFSKPLQYHYA